MRIHPVRALSIIAALAAITCSNATATERSKTKALAGDKIPDYSGTTNTILKINPDWSSEEVETRRITILAESALRRKTIQRFSYTASLDRLEVLEAMTEKVDGRRIPVPASSVITQDMRWGTLAAYWAHTRRKFYDVHEATGSPIAAEAL